MANQIIDRGAGTTIPADERYEAIRRRDPAFDGIFVYGVQTTGVYCRPSCAAAEQAGFRACLRCRPNSGQPARTPHRHGSQ